MGGKSAIGTEIGEEVKEDYEVHKSTIEENPSKRNGKF